MRIETDQGMSGNSTPRARNRSVRFRMFLTARTVGPLDPEEKTNVARRSPSFDRRSPSRPESHDLPLFRQNRGPMQRRHAQPGGIPQLFGLFAETCGVAVFDQQAD